MKKITLAIILMAFFSTSSAQTFSTEKIYPKKSNPVDLSVDAVDELIWDSASDARDVAAVGTTSAAVVGASGSGIMSTMASTGAVIGGGVVAGTALTAGAGGLGAASLMNKYVFDGDTEADEAARVGTYAGATAGTAASVGALAVAGAGPTGLATIGAVVGGGMAAGAVTVLAAPVVAAGLIGGAVYWFFSDDEDE